MERSGSLLSSEAFHTMSSLVSEASRFSGPGFVVLLEFGWERQPSRSASFREMALGLHCEVDAGGSSCIVFGLK